MAPADRHRGGPPPLLRGGGALAMALVMVMVLALALLAPAPALAAAAGSMPPSSTTTTTTTIPEPHPFVHSFDAAALPARPSSPDPLVRYRWDRSVNRTELQLYLASPLAWDDAGPGPGPGPGPPLPAFREVLEAGEGSDGGGGGGDPAAAAAVAGIDVLGAGTVRLDFGTELAGWFEFELEVGEEAEGEVEEVVLRHLTCALSEFGAPLPEKAARPVRYGASSYRLETNDGLYEGVRYVFLTYAPSWHRGQEEGEGLPLFRIVRPRVVAQVRPVAYSATYGEADAALAKIWYSAAYGVRLNMHAHDFGTVLIERGDRVAIQGDQHPTVAAALTAFGGSDASGASVYGLVRESLLGLDSGCRGCHVVDDGILAYPLYWTLSVMDYYWSAGDLATLGTLLPDVEAILVRSEEEFFPLRPDIVWMGWDDRIDDGWCGPCNDEAQLAYASLVVRAFRDFALSLSASGNRDWASLAAAYEARAVRLERSLTQEEGWSDGYGIHASAYAINARLSALDRHRTSTLIEREFVDITNVCSFSPFNQYWILQAMGNANRMDHALAAAKYCFGGMTRVGNGCLWETFDPRYEAIIASGGTKSPNLPSMCHPWSSGVAHWLTEHHVGIKPAKPGYEAVLLAPYISDFNRAVSGSVGTPRGKITVEAALDVRSGTVGVNATVPVRSRIALPALMNGCVLLGFDFGANRSGKTIEAPVPYDAVSEELGTMTSIHPDVASSLLYSNPIAPGRHSVLGLYGGCRTQETSASRIGTASDSPYPPFLPEEYPAQTSIDAKTRGDWIGKFGNEGHLLFGFDDGEDLVQLPPYVGVQSYFMSGGGRHDPPRHFRGQSKNETSFLQDPRDHSRRALRGIGEEVERGRGLVIDVNITNNEPEVRHRVTMYMVAEGATDELTVKAMDFDSRNNIAPLPHLQDFGGGVYWTVEYDAGIRLRVVPLFPLGPARIAAIFFDKA